MFMKPKKKQKNKNEFNPIGSKFMICVRERERKIMILAWSRNNFWAGCLPTTVRNDESVMDTHWHAERSKNHIQIQFHTPCVNHKAQLVVKLTKEFVHFESTEPYSQRIKNCISLFWTKELTWPNRSKICLKTKWIIINNIKLTYSWRKQIYRTLYNTEYSSSNVYAIQKPNKRRQKRQTTTMTTHVCTFHLNINI